MKHYDLLIIGGGINGAGIARDAAGRGIEVGLCEKDDLAAHTSSASTKLIHGGLRYLENYEFGLVRKSLQEREVLLRLAPQIIRPLEFVLPHHTGLRPAWMLRLGLLIYDLLAGRSSLPRSRRVKLAQEGLAGTLRDDYHIGFRYSDCWVEDSRLVTLNAMDAAERGADIMPRTRFVGARRNQADWIVTLQDAAGQRREVGAGVLVNASGPWVGEIDARLFPDAPGRPLRLVRGSHIVTRKLYDQPHAFLFQGGDGRVVFAIPYEHDYTLLGTTEAPAESPDDDRRVSADEETYLLSIAREYFVRPISRADVVWRYSGVRPLYDDTTEAASKVTRDYVLEVDDEAAPALSVYGGKITTYRKLAEQALSKLRPCLPGMGDAWTAGTALPGGDFAPERFESLVSGYAALYPFLDRSVVRRLFRAYGLRIEQLLKSARSGGDLGEDFGGGLYEAELRYLVRAEFAMTADDVLWRRSRLGLHMSAVQRRRVEAWFARRASASD